MNYMKKSICERVLAAVLSFLMVITLMPVNVIKVNAEANSAYGTVEDITGGAQLTGEGTNNVSVHISEKTLQWSEGNTYHGEGWWVGINVIAPDGFSSDATYKVKENNDLDYGSPMRFEDNKHGDNYIQLWYQITPENLAESDATDSYITANYEFDWDAAETADLQIEFIVDPSDIILEKDGQQVYPATESIVTVTKTVGGSVSLNGNNEVDQIKVNDGTDVELNVEAEDGYWISSVIINGEETTVNGKQYQTTIESVVDDVTVDVIFVEVYEVTVTGGANGTVVTEPICQNGSVTVIKDSIVKVTATPEQGYRVGSVKINGEEQSISEENDFEYIVDISVNDTYLVEVTFVANSYTVGTVVTEHGSYIIQNSDIQYNGSTEVVVTPEQGYIVDTVSAEGATVSDIVKDENGIRFTVSEIKSDLNVNVTFKEITKANIDDIDKDIEGIALRKTDNDTVFVVKDGDEVTFTTEKAGMRIYSELGMINGDIGTQTLIIPGDTTITNIELYYQADDELYAEWHVVEMDTITVAEDVTAPILSIEPNELATNGYYNGDVTMNVNIEDPDEYSGIDTVEYWFVYNGVEETPIELTGFTSGNATYSDTIKVDSSVYNSDDIKVIVKATDKAGNVNVAESSVKINTTVPTIELRMDGTQNVNAFDGYYETDTELTITINDRQGTFRTDAVANGLVIEKDGTPILVREDDIVWEHSNNGETHTGKYVFEDEASYNWSFSYINAAGTVGVLDVENSAVDYSFVIDHTAPSALEIVYSPSVVDTFLENATFGFYQASVSVTIAAIDNVAGVNEFVYSYTAQDGTSSTSEVVTSSNISFVGNKASYTFEIPAKFRGNVSFKAKDKSGQISELKVDSKVVVVDNIAPGIVVEYEGPDVSNDKYYNGDRKASIKITEDNFFIEDLTDVVQETGEEYLVITVDKTFNDNTTTTIKEKPAFTKIGDVYTSTIEFTEEADYAFDIKYTDRSGNVYDDYVTDQFVIDKTAPIVEVEFDNNTAFNTNQYCSNRVATITVTDENFDANSVVATVTANGQSVAGYTDYLKDNTNWTDNGNVHTAEVVFDTDAHYTFDIVCVDLAGNTNVDFEEISFTLDKVAPEGLRITYDPTFVNSLIETVTFGFYKAPVKVIVEATDDIAGIDYFTYTYAVQQGSSIINEGKTDIVIGHTDFDSNVGGTAKASFTIPAQFRGFVSFVATDRAGNSEDFFDEKCVVVDQVSPDISVEYDQVDAENGKYFNSDREATIKITESNFFASDLTDLVPGTFEEYLVINVGKTMNDGTYIPTKVRPDFAKDGDVYTAKIKFDEDADYTFDIKYTDRSGNVYDDYEMDEFTIDKVKPEISISYDNNAVMNGNYLKESRIATITVEEHNFRASDIDFDIVANDVTGTKTIDLSTKGYATYLQNQDNWTKSGDTWTAQILLDIEGNYSIDMTYADLAKNEQVVFIHEEFCIDNSKPENLAISYEPEFVSVILETITFGFYQAPVEVTIEATDEYAGVDYFVYSYAVQEDASSTNVGKTDVIVENSAINYTGNKASYIFEIPAQFRGNVSFIAVDRAGNSNIAVDNKVVVVDNVAPGVSVEFDNNDVKNDRYYNADRTATITINESNFFEADIEEGRLVITVEMTLNDGTYTKTNVKPEFVKYGDVCIAKIKFDKDADYTFDIKYTDRSGNVYDSYEKDEFTIDKTNPVLSISYDNNAVVNEKYLKESRTATITVVEHNFRASDINFDIVANDVTGTRTVDLSTKGYSTYLQNQDNWTKSGDTWTAQIVLDIEGNYSIDMTYADFAENPQVAPIEENFCIDNKEPENLKISYVTEFIDVILETITFGFYQAPVNVTIEATDEYAGIDYFKYTYAVQGGTSSTNVGKTDVVVASTAIEYEGSKASYTFEIPAQFRGKVSFTAVDRAGNSDGTNDENVVVVDDKAPEVSVVYDNNDVKYGKYYNADRVATISITEANFFEADIEDELLVITVEKTLDDGTYTKTNEKPEFVKNGDVYTTTVEFRENADYTFDIKYTDRSGNVYDSYEMDEFTIDKVKPTISVSYDNNTCVHDNQFNAERTATIIVNEHNFITDDVVATVTAGGILEETYANYLKDDANWVHSGDIHTAQIEFSTDAHYTFGIECSDLAGNTNVEPVDYGTSVVPEDFTVDKSAPTDLMISINDESVLGTNSVAFDKFYSSSVIVKLGADGNVSGIESLKYQKVTSVTEYDVNGTWLDYVADEGIVVNPSEKFIIYFRAEDRAGNVAIVNSTGIVVDDKEPTGEVKAPDIDILPVSGGTNGLHRNDVGVNIKVVERKYIGQDASSEGYYSGLSQVSYRIFTTDTGAVETGVLFDVNNSKTEGATFDTDNLAQTWNGKINISADKFNSNNVVVMVTAVDNAGNERTSKTVEGTIMIDTTEPEIEVSYDNNNGDVSFGEETYFNKDRIAKIVVTERNFLPELCKIEITNTEGVIPVIGNWSTVYAGGNGDKTTHTAQVVFSEDGDYTLDVSCVDQILNPSKEATAGDSLAPWAFTIDKTAPIVDVVYDNNVVFNENYYNDQRVGTITITEHNFETSRINVSLRATDNGVEVAVPTVSNWSSYGDVHTANIVYSADAHYTFDFDYMDKAGNVIEDMAEQRFCVDKTAPVLVIEKIVDESANSDEGNIGFVMTATDTNFDVFSPVITAVVRNDNKFVTKQLEIGQMTNIKNGKVFTVANIDTDGIYRIDCTVVDMAGNEYSEVTLEKADGTKYIEQRAGMDTLVTFSVNREGSTFEVDNKTLHIIEQYYIQNIKDDVEIVEINVDSLKEYAVTLNGKELEEDKDYSVTIEGGTGDWKKYIYKVSKALFSDEGEYKLVVSSKDKADNNAFSDVKDATVGFVVDRTAPIVTVSGIADDGRYQTDKQLVTLIPTDDGGALNSLVVNMVDGEGNIMKVVADLEGETLMTALDADGGNITFEIEEGLYQNVQVICTDCALGDTGSTNKYETIIKNVSVSSSTLMILWANKTLRLGAIGGASALVTVFALSVIFKNKKRKGIK